MGTSSSKQRSKGTPYTMTVKTGDRDSSLLGEVVFVSFYNKQWDQSSEIKVVLHNLERSQIRTCQIAIDDRNFGDPVYIELRRNNMFKNVFNRDGRWLCDYVRLVNDKTAKVFMFPVNRWISAGSQVTLREYDTSLPQDDPNVPQRRAELERKKAVYEPKMNKKTNMIMVRKLPLDETFSFRYQWDIGTLATKLIAQSAWEGFTVKQWGTVKDIEQLYRPPLLPIPSGLHNWKSDKHFGNQRLTGVNPAMIRLCTQIPQNFAVDEQVLETQLEGLTITDAVIAKRLFIVDHVILQGLHGHEGQVVAPLALFFVNRNSNLMPTAIQLFQDPGPNNPVFYPSDPEYTWITAKCYFNQADASVHEASSHLGCTHLFAEIIDLATNRCLSPSHPIFRLLAPHFLYLLAINQAGLQPLLGEHGLVNDILLVGSEGMAEIIRRKWATWRLDVEGSLPADLQERGLADPAVLPNYHYRDDALRIHGAISRYVTHVVDHYYASTEDLAGDYELQEWARFLGCQDTDGTTGRIKGFPNDGHFETAKEIIDVVTSFIFICSATHAAVNFGQYDNYAFPPSYPGWMTGQPPRDKAALTETDLMQQLPNESKTLETMTFTKLLSDRDTNSLGDFEVQYLYDPVALEALEKFRADLKAIEKTINTLNKTREDKYIWLLPSNVPNSIAI